MKTRGLTLIETIIGIGIVSVLIVTFGVSLLAAVYAQRIKLRNMASALADQQLSTLRSIDTSTLTDQVNGALAGLLLAQGTFETVEDGTAPSASRAFNAATSTSSGLTSLMPLPSDAYGDFTVSAKIKANPGAPVGWKAGLLFRARDLRNHYRVTFSANALALEKVASGVTTTLYSDVRSISAGTWQTLEVVASGSSLTVKLNGTTVTTQTDTSFSVGKAALAAWEGASVNFDDVTVDGLAWNFDAVPVGEIHGDWLRFGLGDLPNGTGTLTIATPYADDSLKRYTVTISWTDRSGTTRTLSHATEKKD